MNIRRSGIPATILIAMLLVLGAGKEASADFRICNRSLVKIDASFAYNDPAQGWTSQGWWNLGIGDCATVFKGNVSSRVFYIYGVAEGGRMWKADDAQDGGAFCISSLKYLAHNRDYRSGTNIINCEAAGLQGQRFFRVDVGPYSDYTHNLTSQNDDPLPRASTPRPVSNTPSPAPPVVSGQGGVAGTACQRFPNLC